MKTAPTVTLRKEYLLILSKLLSKMRTKKSPGTYFVHLNIPLILSYNKK